VERGWQDGAAAKFPHVKSLKCMSKYHLLDVVHEFQKDLQDISAGIGIYNKYRT
jgi:hypothetical protein